MAVLNLTVKVGQVLLVGDALALKVVEKRGQRIGLQIATMMAPIRIDPTGILPQRFACGITGESRYVPDGQMAAAE